jgi:hypothetical protein
VHVRADRLLPPGCSQALSGSRVVGGFEPNEHIDLGPSF